MGILEKTKTYLLGSMEYENGEAWRNKAEVVLGEIGIRCLNPYKKPFILKVNEDESTRNKLRCCDLVDFGICYINPKVPSWGTAEEITTLNREKKPIFIIIEGGKNLCPLWILGMIPHKYIYNSLDEVLNMIKNINDGVTKIDSERWQLLDYKFR